MDAELPARFVRGQRALGERRLVHHEDAPVVRSADAWLREPGGALGDRAVTGHLHRAHADPFVTLARPDAFGDEIRHMPVGHQAVDAHGELAGGARVAIRAKIVRRPSRRGPTMPARDSMFEMSLTPAR